MPNRKVICERYRKNNKESIKLSCVRWRLKKEYGLTLEQYEQMCKRQDYKCIICSKHEVENKSRLCIDHDHKTGKIRMLLCHDCNVGLGRFHDNKDLLFNAIVYLGG